MKQKYLRHLTPYNLNLVQEIERQTALEISIKIAPDDSYGSEIKKNSISIRINNDNNIANESFSHELSHIKRIALENIPQLIGAETKALKKFDNCIEHMIIIPREIACHPSRLIFWENCFSKQLTELDGRSDETAEYLCLMYYVIVRIALPENSPIISVISDMASKIGIISEANILLEKIKASLHSKEGMVLACLEHLKGNALKSISSASFEYLNFGNGPSTRKTVQDIMICQKKQAGD